MVAALAAAAETPQAPKPPAQSQRLWVFAGDWEGTATLTMGGTTVQEPWRHSATKVVGGWGIQGVETGTMGDMGPYDSHYLLGWEPGRDLVHLYTVSNFGETHDHVGTWKDANTLELKYEGVTDGKPMVETITVTTDKPAGYHFTGTVTVGGAVESTISAEMRPRKH